MADCLIRWKEAGPVDPHHRWGREEAGPVDPHHHWGQEEAGPVDPHHHWGREEAGPVDPHHHWVLEMVHTLSIFQETSSLSVNHNFYPIVVPDE